MTRFLIVLLILSLCIQCESELVRKTTYYSNGNKKQTVVVDRATNEKCAIFYDTSGVKTKMFCRLDEELHGEYLEYYSNGQVARRLTYEKGVLHGPKEIYYENGQPKESLKFRQGLREGVGYYYWEDGRMATNHFYEDQIWIKRELRDSVINFEAYYPVVKLNYDTLLVNDTVTVKFFIPNVAELRSNCEKVGLLYDWDKARSNGSGFVYPRNFVEIDTNAIDLSFTIQDTGSHRLYGSLMRICGTDSTMYDRFERTVHVLKE